MKNILASIIFLMSLNIQADSPAYLFIDTDKTINESTKERITDLGFEIASSKENADFIISANFKLVKYKYYVSKSGWPVKVENIPNMRCILDDEAVYDVKVRLIIENKSGYEVMRLNGEEFGLNNKCATFSGAVEDAIYKIPKIE